MMKYASLLCALLLSAPAMAQTTNNEQPIEISATKTVEWLRDKSQYVARENVIVTQGNMTINTDLLTADYREGATSSMEIWQLTAEGNVKIMDDNNTATGDLGVYDVTKGIATLTGQNLSLVSPDQTVTATDRMEYYANEKKATAIGNAKVVRTNDTLMADSVTAFFKDGAAKTTPAPTTTSQSTLGGGNLDRLEADGHVVIKTPNETLHGQKGIYRADSNTAELIGKVKIERGENVLEGERAEVNLNTNVSKLFGSEKAGGRVRGVFFPGSEKKSDKGKAPQASPVPAPFAPVPASPPSNPPVNGGTEGKVVPAPVLVPDPPPVSATPSAPAPAKVSPRIEY